MTKSFFEYLGIADVERVHSQFLAWLLSEDCLAIEKNKKKIFFKNLFQVEGEIKGIYTERNNIDILIQTEKDILVIENKIKSSQHSDQLEKYKEFCAKEFPKYQRHFFFLTLIGEKSSDKDWKRLSYSIIYNKLKDLELQNNNTHSYIVMEYLVFLKKLNNVILDFYKNVKNYDSVFLNGHIKKQNKNRINYNNDNEWFIASNQLETILQKSFLNLLVEKLKPQIGFVSETRGSALVNFPVKSDIEYNGRKYLSGIQIQGNKIKFFFVIQENYHRSKKQWVEKVVLKMRKISADNNKNFGYNKANKPKNLTFVSISKILDIPYWHMSDLVEFVHKEIKNGEVLTNYLISLLKV